MGQPSKEIRRRIYEAVRADLEPGATQVVLKTGIATLCGGGASLFLCGQFGIGTSAFAQHLNHGLHALGGPIGCAVVCGAIFAILPALILRLLTTPLQFRALRRRGEPIAAALWIGAFGALLAYHGDVADHGLAFGAWALSALVVFEVLSSLLHSTRRISLSGASS